MKAKILMRCIDLGTLMETMFSFGPDFLAPVEFRPNMFGYDDLRELAMELEWQNKTPSLFATAVAIETLGQYSLAKNVSIFGVSRSDGFLREAMPDEARSDFANFGEQVMGDEITEKKTASGYQAVVNFLGTEYLYTGPSRLERLVHTLRVSSGGKPGKETLKEIMAEIDEVVEPAEDDLTRVTECYALVIADKGKITVGNFKNLEQFDLEKLQFLGQLEMESGKMLFLPEGNRVEAIDFSVNLHRNYRDF